MWGLWVLSFLVSFFLLGAVFDIHFKSPIVSVTTTHRAYHPGKVKRVVVFVADGLRADTFYKYPEYRPYLTEILERKKGVAWGISDTRVPTESRPGHIALFAGFYEDPSAVFTGWKKNLVEFDTVFNRSDKSVALGSPDIVEMFAQGEAKNKIYSETYSSDWQDFVGGDSYVLDTWVFERFSKLVEQKKLPEDDNVILFLHLLGIDNTGHATKPPSQEYKTALKKVDTIVKDTENLVANYYNDDNTLFLFTSDHGMTDWGSHGSGSTDETETPFVIWSPIVKKMQNVRIRQGDITPLIAGSLGTVFPTNSIGKFPAYIWTDESFSYSNLRANFLQVMELVRTKKAKVISERNLFVTEYPQEEMLMDVLSKTDRLPHSEAIKHLEAAFVDLLNANIFYERYNQRLMVAFAVATFFLLMTVVAVCILALDSANRNIKHPSFILDYRIAVQAGMVSFVILKVLIGWSLWKIGYCFTPIYLLLLLLRKLRYRMNLRQKSSIFWSLALSTVGVQMLVLSFWERSVLSIALMLNLMWILWSQQKARGFLTWKRNLVVHLIAAGVLAIFPAVPIIGKSRSPFFTTLGPIISSLIAGFSLASARSKGILYARDHVILNVQLVLQILVAFLCHWPEFFGTRLISWSTLILAMIFPTLTTNNILIVRLLSIYLSLGTPFAFLGVSYETLFFPSLFVVLIIILKLELEEQSNTLISWDDFLSMPRLDAIPKKNHEIVNVHRSFRRAWLHLFFVLLSFFGTGNIGSVSSFDPSSTRCFVSVFNPWIMMTLMLTKILAPFLLVSSFWRALLPSRVDLERNFGILLILSQGMSLTMFFKVRNEGSWLDIGTSISHFIIVQVTTLFLLIFHFIANYLVTFQLFGTSTTSIPTNEYHKAHSDKQR